MPDVCIHRLHGPTFYDFRYISEFEIDLIVAWWRGQIAEVDLILIKGANAVGKTRVDHARTEAVLRPLRDQPGKNNSSIDFCIDQITVGRADRGTIENGDAIVRAA